jgi:hypothetical protein
VFVYFGKDTFGSWLRFNVVYERESTGFSVVDSVWGRHVAQEVERVCW